jgi:hypothetical protein
MPKEGVTMTSGPEVQAMWDEYRQCYKKCLDITPYTEAEKKRRESRFLLLKKESNKK